MKRYPGKTAVIVFMILFSTAAFGYAHFGMVIPSDNMVMQGDDRQIDVTLSFSHPFEGQGMPLVKPENFFVVNGSERQPLLSKLEEVKVMGHKAWQAEFPVNRPGGYLFCMVPKPYWEPVEDCYIVHYTKTFVAAFGWGDGWDAEVGLKTEIVPLSRPFGLYGGNLFQGIVKLDGKAVPYAEVEVEYYNRDGRTDAPTDYMVTQTIKADKNGVFSYAVPRAGWWGFAALSTSDETLAREGEQKNVELGAVIWVKFEAWQE